MNKKILTIQDISCMGQCSTTVALPIISACGFETCILPSAILSTHTAFTGFTFRDLTEDMPAIANHWKNEGVRFGAIYTGYLGSARQIEIVQNIMAELGEKDCIHIVDPAMADNGKLYPGFDDAYVEEMKKLCYQADIILPNITEAALITDSEYKETFDEEYANMLVDKMIERGAGTIILTGVGFNKATTGVLVYENGEKKLFTHRKIARDCHGTGDVYASAFTGALMRGHDAYDSAKIAGNYVVKCIENTQNDENHWYGVNFEGMLPELMASL